MKRKRDEELNRLKGQDNHNTSHLPKENTKNDSNFNEEENVEQPSTKQDEDGDAIMKSTTDTSTTTTSSLLTGTLKNKKLRSQCFVSPSP